MYGKSDNVVQLHPLIHPSIHLSIHLSLCLYACVSTKIPLKEFTFLFVQFYNSFHMGEPKRGCKVMRIQNEDTEHGNQSKTKVGNSGLGLIPTLGLPSFP